MSKSGTIILPKKNNFKKHEIETAKFFVKLGKNVEFLLPSYTKGVSSPDIKMDGILWEIKSPVGNSRQTIEKIFKIAQKQSKNVIFDLRRISMDEAKAMSKIQREFNLRRGIKRILVIKKDKKLIDLTR